MDIHDKLQGKAREMSGKITGDKKLEMKGKLQQDVGDVKDKIHEMDRKRPKM